MNNKTFFSLSVIILVVIALGVLFATQKNSTPVDGPSATTITGDFTTFCYYAENPTLNGLRDISWTKFSIAGENSVAGEFRTIPAEKDSKMGTFIGNTGPVDESTQGRTITASYTSQAEGMTATEELRIQFNDQSAVALYGEMKVREDGTYDYANPEKLTPGMSMPRVDCQTLDEKVLTDQYIRQNLATVLGDATETVLGGAWYVTRTEINTDADTGTVSYEDGHITGASSFSYTVADGTVTISNVQKLK